MNDLIVVFITGLTTGGMSCLAVQGGLLAASVAHQVERDIQDPKAGGKHITQPILLFLAAKLIGYTLLGFLLGLLGSILQLTPSTRAILQLAIGIFLVGNALRMLDIHPIFRYFAIEPPKSLTRYIRKTAKNGADIITPISLGLLTVFIPCGVTQAMMALAMGTGNPTHGAALMFAFTLGTSPVFFGLAYLATHFSATLEARFTRLAALVIFLLGFLSIEGGLNLLGTPFSLTSPQQTQVAPVPQEQPGIFTVPPPGQQSFAPKPVAPDIDASGQVLTIHALNYGYEPTFLEAEAGEPLTLALVTEGTRSCTRAFVIPSFNVQEILPETGTKTFDIPAQQAGTTLAFTCSMGMYGGQILFN
jgi:sulfite exporter TauE/SafE